MATGSLICGSETKSSIRKPDSILKVFNAFWGLYGGPEGREQATSNTADRTAKDTMIRLSIVYGFASRERSVLYGCATPGSPLLNLSDRHLGFKSNLQVLLHVRVLAHSPDFRVQVVVLHSETRDTGCKHLFSKGQRRRVCDASHHRKRIQ